MERQPATKVKNTRVRSNHLQTQTARSPSAAHPLLELQRAIGNQAVQRLINSPYIQTKLQVSTPEDPAEQEADRVADTVMRMAEPEAAEQEETRIQTETPATGIPPPSQPESRLPIQRARLAVREDEEVEKVAPKLETNLSLPGSDQQVSLAQRETASTVHEEKHDVRRTIQRAQLAVHEDEEENSLQRETAGDEALPASSTIEALLKSSRGAGSPLTESSRGIFESKLNHDFRSVRIHTDHTAAKLNQTLNARAFTTGNDIYLPSQEYQPNTPKGQELLAHELTHVVQQSAGPVSGTPMGHGIALSHPTDAHEQAAAQTARTFVQTLHDPASPGRLSRSAAGSQPASAVFIQRENGESGAVTAAELIESHTSYWNLDEEALGRDLLNRLPGQAGFVSQVLDRLSDGDRDDVAYELSYAASRDQLITIPEGLRIRMVKELVGGRVNDDEEGEIARIWDSFGARLPDVAVANKGAWEDSLDESDQVNELPQVIGVRNTFPWDVIDLARKYIAENRQAILLEGERVGVNLAGTGDVVAEPEYVEGVQRIAVQVSQLQSVLRQLRQIKVGYNTSITYGLETVSEHEFPAPFNPDSPPDRAPEGTEDPPYARWEQVKTQHDRVTAVISGFANLYPSIYVLIQEERLDELAQAGTAAKAKEVIEATLRKAVEKSDEADNKVATQDIEFYDLLPVHARLFSGSSKEMLAPRFPWEHPFYGDLARGILKDHESRQFWISLGLSLLAAAALIAAPFTGGLTAALLVGVGLGIGAGQAAVSWERYLDLSTVGSAHVRDELAVISEGQITAALVEAVLNTVGVFLDAFGAKAASTTQRIARRAVFEASERELKEQLTREAAERLGRQGVRDAALQGGGAALAIAQHELFGEVDPEIEAKAEVRELDLPIEIPAELSLPVDRTVIQRSNGGGSSTPATTGGATAATGATGSSPARVLTGAEFESHVERALLRGEIDRVPRMDFVIPGQYTGSGWGIDRIGIRVNPNTGNVSVFHFEMKYVQPGSPHIPGLGTPSAGTQTGLAWTDNAVEGFLNNKHPVAKAGRERLRRALQNMYPGEYIDINRMRSFLRQKLVNAPVRVIVPDYADLQRLYRQVAALARWGRNVRVRPIRIP